MQNKTILVVDDTAENLDILAELLKDYDIIDTTCGRDVLNIAKNDKIDLILLDIVMPEMNGYEVCKKLKADEKTKNIPVIFLTAKTDEQSIERAYDVGGIDYIVKPFKPKELLARVNTQLYMQKLINDLKKSKEKLKLLTLTDPMTKLYNRRYFSLISKDILNLAKRNKEHIAVLMIDIDRFKNINDSYGHYFGDEVIISLADELREQKRDSDVVFRFGGEEFLILLPNTNLSGAEVLAQKIRLAVENKVLHFPSSDALKYTVSIGVSVSKSDDTQEDIQEVVNRADKALYKAKKDGRNKVVSLMP